MSYRFNKTAGGYQYVQPSYYAQPPPPASAGAATTKPVGGTTAAPRYASGYAPRFPYHTPAQAATWKDDDTTAAANERLARIKRLRKNTESKNVEYYLPETSGAKLRFGEEDYDTRYHRNKPLPTPPATPSRPALDRRHSSVPGGANLLYHLQQNPQDEWQHQAPPSRRISKKQVRRRSARPMLGTLIAHFARFRSPAPPPTQQQSN